MTNFFSSGMMQAMLSADNTMTQARVQGAVRNQAEGQMNLVQSEISTDGFASASMAAQLERSQETVQNAEQSQMGALTKANIIMKEAVKKEAEQTEKTEQAEKTDTFVKSDEAKKAEENVKAPENKISIETAAGTYDEAGRFIEAESSCPAVDLMA